MTTSTPTRSRDDSPHVLKILFLTLFLDLVGFSIIFPLYPSMLNHYLALEGDQGLLGSVISAISQFQNWAGPAGNQGLVVLFGGVLGSVYSLLQFICSPLIGSLSDRFGRKPILFVCVAGIALSYVLWILAGQFWILVLARILGGICSGNISTATAVVADVTDTRNRARGMAVIGMAFGLGFILGPVIGGLTGEIDLTQHWPGLAQYGINPFSLPALVAFLLALLNLALIAFVLPETRRDSSVSSAYTPRPINPITMFRTEAYPGVTRTNFAYFLFLVAFSGMEFSLSFLAAERFGAGPRNIAYMLLFVGVTLATVQGAYVRRYANRIGERAMAVHGLLCTIPGLALVGAAANLPLVYLGLFLMAVGSAQVIPCMTALVSLYSPENEQGRVLGVFRSLGALARAVGPLLACLAYWRFGASNAYFIAAVAILAPVLLASTLPRPSKSS